MKTWKVLASALLVLVGFCAGIGWNFFPLSPTVHGASGPPEPPPAALKSVAHNATLSGNGTDVSPLGIANGGVGTPQLANGAVNASKLSASATPSPGQVLGFNGNLAWQNAPVGGVKVVDSLGHEVGLFMVFNESPNTWVLRQIGEFRFLIQVNGDGFEPYLGTNMKFFHAQPNCAGPRYFFESGNGFIRRSANTSSRIFFAGTNIQQLSMASVETFGSPSSLDPNQPGMCFPASTNGSFGLVTTLDLSTLNLTPPFLLEF